MGAEINEDTEIIGFTSDEQRNEFINICIQYGIDISQTQLDRLEAYLRLMLQKNQVINLTAIRTWDAGLILHLLDSMLFLEDFDYVYPDLKTKPFLDMGTGAGLPGIPLAIMRNDRTGVLCDSVKKKVNAVDSFIRELQLNDQLATSTERLEVLAHDHKRAFGCVVARAVASLPVLVEYATPLLEHDGSLIVSKGRPDESEIAAGDKAAKLCGLKRVGDHWYDLPNDQGRRRLLVYEKVREASIRLPREVGLANKQPLA